MAASDISTLYFSCVATGDEFRMCSFSAGDKQVSYLRSQLWGNKSCRVSICKRPRFICSRRCSVLQGRAGVNTQFILRSFVHLLEVSNPLETQDMKISEAGLTCLSNNFQRVFGLMLTVSFNYSWSPLSWFKAGTRPWKPCLVLFLTKIFISKCLETSYTGGSYL